MVFGIGGMGPEEISDSTRQEEENKRKLMLKLACLNKVQTGVSAAHDKIKETIVKRQTAALGAPEKTPPSHPPPAKLSKSDQDDINNRLTMLLAAYDKFMQIESDIENGKATPDEINQLIACMAVLQGADTFFNQVYPDLDHSDPRAKALQDMIKNINAAVQDFPSNPDPANLKAWLDAHGKQDIQAIQSAFQEMANAFNWIPPHGGDTDNIVEDIEKWIFGSLLNHLKAGLSNEKALVSAEIAMGNRINSIISIFNRSFPQTFLNLSLPHKPYSQDKSGWTKFQKKLAAIASWEKIHGTAFFNRLQGEIASMYLIAKACPGNASLMQNAHALMNKMKHMKEFMSQVAKKPNVSDWVQTVGTSKSRKLTFKKMLFHTILTSKGIPVVSRTRGGLTRKTVVKIKTPNGRIVYVTEVVYKTAIKTATAHVWASKFGNINHDFKTAIQHYGNDLQSSSQTLASQLRSDLSTYQEIIQNAANLLQTYFDMLKAAAQNMKGGQ